jgi:hypothetical protein
MTARKLRFTSKMECFFGPGTQNQKQNISSTAMFTDLARPLLNISTVCRLARSKKKTSAGEIKKRYTSFHTDFSRRILWLYKVNMECLIFTYGKLFPLCCFTSYGTLLFPESFRALHIAPERSSFFLMGLIIE